MTKKCFCLWLLVSFCFVFTGVHWTQADDEFENMLRNADFEDGVDAPWTMWVEGGGVVATKSLDKGESHTGKRSLLIDVSSTGNGQRVELHQNPIVVEQGQQLTYAFWAKTEEDAVVEGVMIMNHRQDPWTSYGSKSIKITDEWQEFWVAANIPSDDPIAGIYVELRDSAKIRVWFDHFRLYEGEYFEEDEEGGRIEQAVDPRSKVASRWAAVKSHR